MKTEQEIRLKDYQPSPFQITDVHLTFEITPFSTKVTSTLTIRKDIEIADKNTSLVLDKDKYDIISVVANGMVLIPGEYDCDDETFRLARTPELFELEITNILHPQDNTSLEGLYQSGRILCTQCEAQGFRKITPFIDRPDVMATYTCTIIADQDTYPVLLSNGNAVKKGKLDNNRHFVQWQDPFKKPSYLFAMVAGDLACLEDIYKSMSGRTVDLKIYSEAENIDQCHYAMAALKDAMKWDETRFGLEYDLDLYQIVAINDFNAGAMENKGLNIFNARYVLADPKTATDDDYLNVQSVIAHEYFHNWTGNRVTLRNWFQLSLKEGLTVFRDQEFSSDLNSRDVKRIETVNRLRTHQFSEDSGTMAHPVRPESYIKMDNFYTATVYEKGAEVVRMIHTFLGEALFQKGMRHYFDQYDGNAITIEDFIATMEKVSERNFDQFMHWYTQSGTPVVTMTREYDADRKTLFLTFKQSTRPDQYQQEKQPLHIPVRFNIIDPHGNDMIAEQEGLIELFKEEETLSFENMPENALPSVFRQFSAPVKIQTDLTNDELAFLMAHDRDGFNRWDAAQTLFIKEIQQAADCLAADQDPEISESLIQAFEKALLTSSDDRAFFAKTLRLPQEIELKDHFKPIDVDAIHQARNFVKKQIAVQLKEAFLNLAEQCSVPRQDPLSPAAVADRQLKNLSLSYLGSLQEPASLKLIEDMFRSADNMTDEAACFKILSQTDPQTRQRSADHFFAKWKDHPLVLDKWFAIQAQSILPDTLENVVELTKHPSYSLKNPNRVRALIFSLAMLNPVIFHTENGNGYDFIAQQICLLDGINPQVAARLASCFNQWQAYDEHRQILMKKALEAVQSKSGLSKNVYEIISKALAGQ